MSRLHLIRSRALADWSPLRHDRGFRTLWLGQLGSALGRETARIALPLHVYLLTDSPAAIGLVAVAQLIPTLLFSIAGGALADALDRRRLMIGAQIAMAVASGGLVVTAFMDEPAVPVILAFAFVLAGLHPVEQPARMASVARLVPSGRLTSAIALTSLNFQASSVVGPGIAGVLIAVAGLPAAYALQAGGYVWAALATSRMEPLPPLERAPRSRIALISEGVRFVRRQRVILSTFAIDLNAMIFGLPIALFPVLAIDVFGAGAAEVGLLAAARGAGAFLAALFSGWIPHVRHLGRAVLLAVSLFSISTLVLGITGLPLLAGVIFIGVCGAADLVSAVMRNAIVQATTPDELRGRVTAFHSLATQSGPRLGDLRAALMAEFVGAGAAIFVGGIIALAGVAGVAKVFPELPRFQVSTAKSDGSDVP